MKISPHPQPVISLCHATARLPIEWLEAFDSWLETCDHPERVEYVLTMQEQYGDKRSALPGLPLNRICSQFGRLVLEPNRGRKCCADGWNTACAASSGQIIICIADDLFPPQHWDTKILEAIPDLNRPCVLAVDYQHSSSQGPAPLLAFSMMTRTYYEMFGYANNPEYESIQADVEFTEVARRLGAIVDARHLKFEHVNPEQAKWDSVYKWTRRKEAQELGAQVLDRNRRKNFGITPDMLETVKRWQPSNDQYPRDEVFGPGVKVHIANDCDEVIYRDIFDDQEYKTAVDTMLAQINGSAPFILDLGMNVGYFAQYAAARLFEANKKFTIHGFEAAHANVEECRKRFASAFGQVTSGQGGEINVTEGLVGKRSGYGCFRLSSSHPAHQLVERGGQIMPFVDVDKIVPHVPIDLLKVDIEGAEEIFSDNYPELLGRTKVAVVEFHNGYCNVDHARGTFRQHFSHWQRLKTTANNTVELFWRDAQ